jgi:hypothetical protein
MAVAGNVLIGGDDFKSGQTKLKSVLVDFLVGAGLKPVSIVSYNHLGNNDGCNLSAPQTFRSKEISKSNVVDDMVGPWKWARSQSVGSSYGGRVVAEAARAGSASDGECTGQPLARAGIWLHKGQIHGAGYQTMQGTSVQGVEATSVQHALLQAFHH